MDGNALALQYPDCAFDLTCEFGALHHISRPSAAIGEMLRVAKAGIFISDTNNFGGGSMVARTTKQVINALGLWRVANLLKTKGKGYMISEGDGLYYSYSVFNDVPFLKKNCCALHIMNTRGTSSNHYRQADHVALLGIKDPAFAVGSN